MPTMFEVPETAIPLLIEVFAHDADDFGMLATSSDPNWLTNNTVAANARALRDELDAHGGISGEVLSGTARMYFRETVGSVARRAMDDGQWPIVGTMADVLTRLGSY